MNAILAKRLVAVFVVCALSLSLIAAVPDSPDAPQPLHNEQWLSGEVLGSRGGAFNYYSINYPGDNSVITIEVRFKPADPVTKSGFGFNVYGTNGFLLGWGIFIGERDGHGVLGFQYSDRNPATWLVQVYNYIPNQHVGYGIVVKDLHEPKPKAQAAEAPAPRPAPPVPLIGAGYLTGWPGGTYTYYNVTLGTADTDLQLTMTSSGDSSGLASGVGFVVYGPTGEACRGTANGVPGERSATLSAKTPGVYRIQVYNYVPGLTISYVLRNATVVR